MLDVLIFDYIHYNFKQLWHVLMNPGWWSYKDWLLTSGRATVHQFGVGYLSKMSLFFLKKGSSYQIELFAQRWQLVTVNQMLTDRP